MTPSRQWMLLGVAIAAAAAGYGFHRAERDRAVHELERRQEVEALRRELSELKTDHAAQARLTARLTGTAAGSRREGMAVQDDPELDEGKDAESEPPEESALEPEAPEMS